MKFGKKKTEQQPEVVDRSALVLAPDETRWAKTKKWLKPTVIIAIILLIIWQLFASLVLPVLRTEDVLTLPKRKVETFDFAPLSGVTLPAGVPEYMTPVARKGDLTLCVCVDGGADQYGSKGEFCVVKGDGEQIWFSNPQDRNDPAETATGKFKWEVFSQIVITTYDEKTTATESYNSYWHSTSDRADNKDSYEIKSIADGFVSYYTFANAKITVPLYVRLNDTGFEVFTLENQIKEKSKKIHLSKVGILPYFNSGSIADEGYMLVPDGSGSIINFNNGKNEGITSNIAKYNVPIYGPDTALSYDYASSGTYAAALPVYGIKNNDTSVVSVITEGDSAASIEAYTSGSKNTQNQVYPIFERYTSGAVTIGERGDWTAREVQKYHLDNAQFSIAEVKYLLLEKDADYSDMAAAVREYMLDNGLLVKRQAEDLNNMTFFTNFIGGQYKKESVAGILVNKLKAFTSVDNINTILDEFEGVGIDNVVVSYEGYNKQDIRKSVYVTGISIPSGLGSVKKLSKLYDRLDGKLYLGYNPININSNGSGLKKNSSSAKSLGGRPIALYTYSVATGYAGAYSRGATALSALHYERMMSKYINNVNKTGTNFGVKIVIEKPHYTNFSRTGFISREGYSIYMEDMLAKADENNSVMMQYPNYYQLKYTDYAEEVPLESSGYDITDYSVPFYHMVVSGSLSYTGSAINSEGDIKDSLMKTLETGSLLYYSFIYDNPYEVKDTWYQFLYGASYENGFEGAVAAYQEVTGVYKKLGSNVLRGHNVIAEGVSESIYENGNKILFNYTRQDYTTEQGIKIPADSYVVVSQEGAVL